MKNMKIVYIQPLNVWFEGNFVNVNKLGIISSNDNLVSQAEFKYFLYSDDNLIIVNYLYMTGEDYLNWNGSNDGAAIWVANQLNLTII